MPSSTEVFEGVDNLFPKGMSGVLPPGMFGDMSLAAGKGVEPSPEEMEAAAEAARYTKLVAVKEFHANTFDLGKKTDLARYKREIVKLYDAIKMHRGVVSYNEKKLMVIGGKPRMVVHLEWYEYDMKVTDNMTGAKYNTAGEFLEYKHAEKLGHDKETHN